MFEELKNEYGLSDECVGAFEKIVQSETDKVRTDYSQKLKNANEQIESLKPKEKTKEELELETLRAELSRTKFNSKLKDLGVDDKLANYLKSDIDIDEFGEYYKQFSQTRQDYIAKNHAENCGITKEQFKKMSISERAELYQNNPTLYATLTN